MPWVAMQKALTVLRANISTPPDLSNLFQRLGLAFKPGKRYSTMPWLLQASRGRRSTDLRDQSPQPYVHLFRLV